MLTLLEARRGRYSAVSSALAQVDSRQMNALLAESGSKHGWGATHTIRLAGSKVFVKRIPLTQLEYDKLFSTANLYGLPPVYNYGIGSAGFGAFRELVAHIKTTNWVLAGEIENFPLLYHYRIQPFDGERKPIDEERHSGYIAYWNSDANLDRYIREHAVAKYEILLFLEYFPHVYFPWLSAHLDRSGMAIESMLRTLTFLREHGVIHFDAHYWNIVVDDERPYLADYGLVLDKGYALDDAEQVFFRRNIDYDHATFLSCLGSHAVRLYQSASPAVKARLKRRYSLDDGLPYDDMLALLFDRIEPMHADGTLKLDAAYIHYLVANRELIMTMHRFYTSMRNNNRKDTPFPHTKIRRLLKESGLR